MTHRSLTTTVVALCTVLTAHNPVLAVNPEMCAFYADSAVDAQAWNHRSNCRIPDSPRFSSDKAHHQTWCQSARIETVETETGDRLNELNGCNKNTMCESYASSAKQFADLNGSLHCGFGGPRWNPDREAHKAYCMQTDKENSYSEARGRIADMDRCTTCDLYAKEALRYVNLRAISRCGKGAGPRWSTDRQVHFGWCMAARLSSLQPEQQARADEVLNCNR